MEERDLEARPYTPDEIRVGEFIQKLAPDIGWGDDPIGFLMASYMTVLAARNDRRQSSSARDHLLEFKNEYIGIISAIPVN